TRSKRDWSSDVCSSDLGTDPHAYIDPYADIPSFRKRDAAREGLVELVSKIMDKRIANPPENKEDRDLLDVLVSVKDDDGSLRFRSEERRVGKERRARRA